MNSLLFSLGGCYAIHDFRKLGKGLYGTMMLSIYIALMIMYYVILITL
jgi:hypothetical protein